MVKPSSKTNNTKKGEKKGNILISIITTIGYILLIISLAAISFTMISTRLSNNIPVLGGYYYLKVVTGSMEPTIPVGRAILVKKINESEIKTNTNPEAEIGDGTIITYYHTFTDKEWALYGDANFKLDSKRRAIITHRVINKGVDDKGRIYYITKGDNNPTKDPWVVYYDEILGEVTNDLKFISDFLTFISHWSGMVVLVIIPLGMILISDIITLIKILTNGDEEEEELAYDGPDGKRQPRDYYALQKLKKVTEKNKPSMLKARAKALKKQGKNSPIVHKPVDEFINGNNVFDFYNNYDDTTDNYDDSNINYFDD